MDSILNPIQANGEYDVLMLGIPSSSQTFIFKKKS